MKRVFFPQAFCISKKAAGVPIQVWGLESVTEPSGSYKKEHLLLVYFSIPSHGFSYLLDKNGFFKALSERGYYA